MAVVYSDVGAGQPPRPAEEAKVAPGEGMPTHLYEQVKQAIYHSHGKSLTAVTMQKKLDDCHSPFQLQKFLIRWGAQFSKLAMLGVRLEMMAIAQGGGNAANQPPDQPAGQPFEPKSTVGKDLKKALLEHATWVQRSQQDWAETMAQLNAQSSTLENEAQVHEHQATLENARPERTTQSRVHSATKAETPAKSAIDSRASAGNPDSRPRGLSASAKRTTVKATMRRTDANASITSAAEARVRLAGLLKRGVKPCSNEWRALKRKERELEARPYWRQSDARPASPERQRFRSTPLFEARAPLERPALSDPLSFRARPMPRRPDGASHGLPSWIKVALSQRIQNQVGAALHAPTYHKNCIASIEGRADQPKVDGGPETQEVGFGDNAKPSTRSDLGTRTASADCLEAPTPLTRMCWESADADVLAEPLHATANHHHLDQQHQHQTPRPPTQAGTRSASVQLRTQSPRVAYRLRAASPPQASHPRRPQSACASVGRSRHTRQSVQSGYCGSPGQMMPQTARMEQEITAIARPRTASTATRWVDIEPHRPSLIVG